MTDVAVHSCLALLAAHRRQMAAAAPQQSTDDADHSVRVPVAEGRRRGSRACVVQAQAEQTATRVATHTAGIVNARLPYTPVEYLTTHRLAAASVGVSDDNSIV